MANLALGCAMANSPWNLLLRRITSTLFDGAAVSRGLWQNALQLALAATSRRHWNVLLMLLDGGIVHHCQCIDKMECNNSVTEKVNEK